MGTAQASSSLNIYATELWGPITIAVPSLGTTNVSGQGAIAQVIVTDGDDDLTSTGINYEDVVKNASGNYIAQPTPALDQGVPFPHGYTLNASGVMNGGQGNDIGTSAFGAPGTGYSGDEPYLVMFPNTLNIWKKATFSDTFNTWVMYQPSGGIWVPLQMLTWSPKATGMPPPGGNITAPDGTSWAVPSQTFSGGTPTNTPNYPQWVSSNAAGAFGSPTSP